MSILNLQRVKKTFTIYKFSKSFCFLKKPPPRQDIGIKKHKPSFDIIKEQNLNPLLPDEQRKVYHRFTLASNMMNETQFRYKKLTDMVPFGIAETSDKFVAILNIVKQQDARIKELEQELSGRISDLEDDWRDRMDEVYEAKLKGNTKRFSKR